MKLAITHEVRSGQQLLLDDRAFALVMTKAHPGEEMIRTSRWIPQWELIGRPQRSSSHDRVMTARARVRRRNVASTKRKVRTRRWNWDSLAGLACS